MPLLVLFVPALAIAAELERPMAGEPYQPYVFSTTGRSLGLGGFAVELGGGWDGLRAPEEEEEEEEEELGSRGMAWWESAVGLGGGVQIETALALGDQDGGFRLVEGRAEARVEVLPERLDAPVDLAVGLGWAVDAREAHALTGVVAASARFGRVDTTATVRVAHFFAEGRDPLDLRISLGSQVVVNRWLRAGLEYLGQELEEVAAGPEAVDGGGRHALGPTVAASLAGDHLRLQLLGGVSLAAWGVGPVVQGSVAGRF